MFKGPTVVYLHLEMLRKNNNLKISVTNSISSFLLISIVIPNFKSHNIIMSARVYFMKRVKDCKYVYIIMSPQVQPNTIKT